MKKADFITNLILVPLDFVTVFLAALSAYALRFSDRISQIWPVFYDMSFQSYISLSLKVSLLAIIIFALTGFYAIKTKKLAKEIPRIISGVSTVVIFLVMAIFLQRELFSSRFIIILAWALAIIYLFVLRIIVYLIRNGFFKKGRGLSTVVVLGEDNNRKIIVEEYKTNPVLGFKVVGQFNSLEDLKNSAELKEQIEAKKIDIIMQTDSSLPKEQALDLLVFCQENHIVLKYVANLFQAQNLNIELSSLVGLPLVEIKGTPLEGWHIVSKHLFDFWLALFLLILLAPLFIVLAILIKITSPGPVFVRLGRVGKKGKIFGMYKFRSMVKNAEKMKAEILAYNERKDGPLFKMKYDPRITKFGSWLRKTSLDEWPQLFNVLRGQMSLVGPRPHEPGEVSRYERGYKKLLSIRPGMTGSAQVSGRSDLLFAEEAKLDIFYIENWSMLLDIIIILKTPWVLMRGK
jgi:exopolysaccharide biosynthesis polyprenyl glycosylphosphotransferase